MYSLTVPTTVHFIHTTWIQAYNQITHVFQYIQTNRRTTITNRSWSIDVRSIQSEVLSRIFSISYIHIRKLYHKSFQPHARVYIALFSQLSMNVCGRLSHRQNDVAPLSSSRVIAFVAVRRFSTFSQFVWG